MVIAYVSGRPQGFLGALERGIERGAEYATEEFLERSGFNNGFGFNNYNGYNGYDGYNGYNGGYDNYGENN